MLQIFMIIPVLLGIYITERKNKYIDKIFTTWIFLGVISFFIVIFLASDTFDSLKKYFLPGIFEDFFTPIMKKRNNTYLEPHYSSYPALANIIFLGIKKCFSPTDIEIAYSKDSLLEGARYLEHTELGTYLVFMFMSVFILLTFIVLYKYSVSNLHLDNIFLIAAILFSGPFLFFLYRGNNVFMVLPLVLLYLILYNSENKFYREVASICLAISVALKIYPVVLGILLLRRGRIKDAIHAMIYGIIFTFSPFAIYHNTDNVILQFFKNLGTSDIYKDNSIYAYNYNISINSTLKNIFKIIDINVNDISVLMAKIIIVVLGISVCLFVEEEWKKIMSLLLIMIWLPNGTYIYVLAFTCIALLQLLADFKYSKMDYIYLVLFCILYIPYNLPRIQGLWNVEGSIQTTYGILILQISLVIFGLVLLVETIINTLKKHKFSREKSNA